MPPPDPLAAALAHARGGRLAQALAAVEAVLEPDPRKAAAWLLKANLQLELGDAARALAAAEQALALKPDARGLTVRGDALQALGRLEAAVESYDQALAARPDHAPALVNRGNALRDLNRPDDALASYDAALASQPELAAAHANRSRLLCDLGRSDEALAAAERAVRLLPAYAKGWQRQGDALMALGRFEDALASYRTAAGHDARSVELAAGVASALQALGRYDEGLAALDAAEALDPEGPLVPYQRALLRLTTCDFARGWRDYEARWRMPAFQANSSGFVSADLRQQLNLGITGADLRGRAVLVVGEQGIGDQLMHASMLPDLLANARSVTWVCDRRLHGLLGEAFPAVRFLDSRDTPPPAPGSFDQVVAAGSLGGAYRRSLSHFPGAPFLRPRQALVDAWDARVGPRDGRLRIGLSWRGGTDKTDRARRSIPLSRLQPLLSLAGCAFVSLQYGDAQGEASAAGVQAFPAADIDDLEDLAALIANLDLVVSVQTAVVHLCGAIGQGCLAMLPVRPEWRYTAAAPVMPWYGSVRLLRQAADGEWGPVVDQVAAAIARQR